MEQARYWMWPKRKLDLTSSPHHHLLAYSANASSTSNRDSWEEQAFAEDAAGALGGCIWPPRSYACSFCRREFRSAQALGGHMNVHRRDRARLKQSSPSNGDGGVPNGNNHAANPSLPLEAQYTAQGGGVGGGTFLQNRNSDSDHGIRVSTNIQEQYKNNGLSEWSNVAAASRRSRLIPDVKNREDLKVLIDIRKNIAIDEAKNNLKMLDSSCRDHKDERFICGTRTTTPRPTDQEASSCKRRRLDPPFGLYPTPGSEILFSSMEELDLELRLGDPPKVK